jgi:hypothetical protein
MVGRFINHEGKQRNLPSVRFGHISQMPNEKIRQDFRSFDQESFLIECRSIGGYSGSPVFVYISEFEERPTDWELKGFPPEVITRNAVGMRPHLLGIEWGILSKWEPVCDAKGNPVNSRSPQGLQVDTNSGMMAVVPVWKLMEMLDMPVFVERRRKDEEKYFKEMATSGQMQAPAAMPTQANRPAKVTPSDQS